MPRLPGLLAFLPVAIAACGGVAPRSDLEWQHRAGESIALLRDGEPVWRFCCGDDHAKPCFHPLALPGGRVLTVDGPADHRWHHGLWFSWKLIDGVNYWEHDGQTGRPVGRTSWRLVECDPRADGSARIVLDLDYAPPDGAPVLAERRVLEVTEPGTDGGFAIDWHSEFEARAACTLDRTPLPGEPGGKAYGGYAGLSLRLAQLDDRDALTSEGPVEWNAQDRFRGTASAFDYRGELAGQPVGVAILDHPDNLGAPSPWYAIRSPQMTFFTPAVLCYGPRRLTAGARFGLRYRVVVHTGRWSEAQLAAAAAAWLRPPTSTRTPRRP